MEEAQKRPDGESERGKWLWLWKVVPCEDLFLEDASIGCTLVWRECFLNSGKSRKDWESEFTRADLLSNSANLMKCDAMFI